MTALGWEDCILPWGASGWCVYLEVDGAPLTLENSKELRNWMENTLGLDQEVISDSIYGWGATFAHEDQALLCFLAHT